MIQPQTFVQNKFVQEFVAVSLLFSKSIMLGWVGVHGKSIGNYFKFKERKWRNPCSQHVIEVRGLHSFRLNRQDVVCREAIIWVPNNQLRKPSAATRTGNIWINSKWKICRELKKQIGRKMCWMNIKGEPWKNIASLKAATVG